MDEQLVTGHGLVISTEITRGDEGLEVDDEL